MAMVYRRLGSTDLTVSAIGLGGGRLGATLRAGTDNEVMRMLVEALDRGVTFYDTADSYGQGKSEQLIGSAFRSRRQQVVIATKTGYRLSAAAGVAARFKPLLRPFIGTIPGLRGLPTAVRSSQVSSDFSAAYISRAVEASLRRLQTDCIDLYQLHNPSPEVLRSGEVFAVLEQLRAQGKIRYYGVAYRSVDDAVASLPPAGVASLQVPVSLVNRAAVHRLLPFCLQHGVALVARQPLASGALVPMGGTPGRTGGVVENGGAACDFQFLATTSRSLVQAAIQFVLSLQGVASVLVGTSTICHLRENLGALAAPPLSDADLSRIRDLGDAERC